MLKEVRHSRIRDLLDERGEMRVSEINKALEVSEATIRRDLDELASLGQLRRTHGGALRVEVDREPPHLQRRDANSGEKDLIGRAAAALVQADETVFLGSGTTVAAMVPHLVGVPGLRVITNSIPVVTGCLEFPELEVIVIGGLLRHSEGSTVSTLAEDMIRSLRADRVFMGVRAIDAERGISNGSLAEATTDRAILGVSDHRVIVADHTKFGQRSTFEVGPIADATVVVTSSKTDGDHRVAIARDGVEILVAEDALDGGDAA